MKSEGGQEKNRGKVNYVMALGSFSVQYILSKSRLEMAGNSRNSGNQTLDVLYSDTV